MPSIAATWRGSSRPMAQARGLAGGRRRPSRLALIWPPQIRANPLFLFSGGVTYAILLALFPCFAAAVSVYGLFLDSSKVEQRAAGVLPEQSRQLLADELHKLAKSRRLCRCVRHPRCRQRPPLPLRRWPHRHAHRKADEPRRCLAHGPAPCRGTWHEGSDRLPHVFSRNRPPILKPAAHWKTHRPWQHTRGRKPPSSMIERVTRSHLMRSSRLRSRRKIRQLATVAARLLQGRLRSAKHSATVPKPHGTAEASRPVKLIAVVERVRRLGDSTIIAATGPGSPG
jgi:hypothetical protein